MEKPKYREMEVSEPWASLIFEGKKKVEVRKNDPTNWGSVMHADILCIVNRQTGEKRWFYVKDVRKYKSLDECIIAEGVRNLLPGKTELMDAQLTYLSFDGISLEALQRRAKEFEKFGCIAIELKPWEKPK